MEPKIKPKGLDHREWKNVEYLLNKANDFQKTKIAMMFLQKITRPEHFLHDYLILNGWKVAGIGDEEDRTVSMYEKGEMDLVITEPYQLVCKKCKKTMQEVVNIQGEKIAYACTKCGKIEYVNGGKRK